jgi:protein SCO1/2
MAAAPALTVATLLLAAVPVAAAAPRADAIPLIDQAGRRFALRDLRGRPFAVTFIASRCTDACPILDAQFALVQRRLAALRSPAQLVTITLDPGYDTPFVMARLAHDYAADPRRWRLASGTMRDVTALRRAFGVGVAADARGVPDVHDTFVYVIGRDGSERTLFASTNLVDDLVEALER